MNIKDLILFCFGNDLLIKFIWACCGMDGHGWGYMDRQVDLLVENVMFYKIVVTISKKQNSQLPKGKYDL